MAKRKIETGLGRGLDALFGDPDLPAQGEGSVSLPISQVEPGLNQPRKRFDPESLADLAESIRVHGAAALGLLSDHRRRAAVAGGQGRRTGPGPRRHHRGG